MSITFALLAFCIGGAALLGWIFDIEILKRIHPTLVNMKANTAVCVMLSAACLLLLENRPISDKRRLLVQVCAATVAIVGLITFTEHLFNWNTGLDQLLFYESPEEAGDSFPGRMGIAASLDFLFLGIAILFLDARSTRWSRMSNNCVLLVVAVTLLVFLYYFYGIERFERIGLYFTIALHTVVAFLSLSAAILLARPERGIVGRRRRPDRVRSGGRLSRCDDR